LLGAGESGKTTFTKQLKSIVFGDLRNAAKCQYIPVIYGNIMYVIQSLISASQTLSIPLSQDNMEKSKILLDPQYNVQNNPNSVQIIKDIYNDGAMKDILKFYATIHYDSALYYIENIDRIFVPGYIPTEDDILRARHKTTGIQETKFEINGETFVLLDVGGQRSERRKWVQCFEGITLLIFFISLSDYDLFLYEDSDVNRMKESIRLFEELVNCRYFEHVPILLFFNKTDVFEKKIITTNITNLFPEYSGTQTNEEAREYIKMKYIDCLKRKDKEVFAHYIQATDKKCVSIIWEYVRTIFVNSQNNSIIL